MTFSISSEPAKGIHICGFGAATPIGMSALSSAAAARAGIAGFSAHPFMVDAEGNAVIVALCPWLPETASVADRLIHCLISAVRESLAPIRDRHGQSIPTCLFVNLPTQRPGLPETLSDSVLGALKQAFPNEFSKIHLGCYNHAGCLIAIRSAVGVLAGSEDMVCIVAGADSYIEPDTLEWLEETERLHGAGPYNNAWGFLPGEAAGAIALAGAHLMRYQAIEPLGRVIGIGVGRETKLNRRVAVCLGEGLSDAFESAFSSIPEQVKVTDIYCDMNGDPYRADEYAFAASRMQNRFFAATDFVAPADCWGDVGAASAALGLALHCVACAKGYSSGPVGCVWASSDTGERGVVVVSGPS